MEAVWFLKKNLFLIHIKINNLNNDMQKCIVAGLKSFEQTLWWGQKSDLEEFSQQETTEGVNTAPETIPSTSAL